MLTLLICGVVPIIIVHLAYWLNIRAGAPLAPEFVCNPYTEGCVSTSRAVRSGPGLLWFKAVMLPMAAVLVVAWRSAVSWMASLETDMPGIRRWTLRLGIGGAVALVFYVLFLGTEGEMYSWLRRYGVVFFFGLTALAQLLTARYVVGAFHTQLPRSAAAFIATVSLQWAIGVFSVLKGYFFDDPEVIDRLQNITEWWMIVAMCLGFVFLGLLFRRKHAPQ
ncbi:MAG TPA: hypothetical protein VMN03_10955 [Burkholderiales bacterium]|nr:hypothetical protein [Burkholderiales bacterium]